MDTKTISFRAHKNMLSWLTYAVQGGFKNEAELIRLIILREALTGALESGASSFLRNLFSRQEVNVGNSKVYAIRVEPWAYFLIKDIASQRNKSVSEFCHLVTWDWWMKFQELNKAHGDRPGPWLTNYAVNLKAKIKELVNVYAQKSEKLNGIAKNGEVIT